MKLQWISLLLLSSTSVFGQEVSPDQRLRETTATLREIMAAPDQGIPKALVDRARCMVVIPGMKKAAFIVGGEYGRGFASCRTASGWSAPAPVRIGGGSFGFQLGVDSTDIVLLVMDERGMKRLLSDKFSIGADAAAAAGPVGRDAAADTDISLRAEILSWSRTHGLFAGVSLDGTVVEHDEGETKKLYGRALSNQDIIEGRTRVPAGAHRLVREMDQVAPAHRS